MSRSPVLGLLALYPVAVLVAVTWLPEEVFAAGPTAGAFSRFFAERWFPLVVASVAVIAIFFSVHAGRRMALPLWRRLLWILGFWSVGPIVLPAYWWVEGRAS
jgi:hypothetical protein